MYELIRHDEQGGPCIDCGNPASVRVTPGHEDPALFCKDDALKFGVVADFKRFDQAISAIGGSASWALKGFGEPGVEVVPTITVWHESNVFTVTAPTDGVQGVTDALTHGLMFIQRYEQASEGGAN